jgi:hypothetical protein
VTAIAVGRGPSGASVHGDGGSVTLGLAAVFPVCLALVLLVVQTALVFHARDIAQAAAQEGLRQARLYDGTADAGRHRAEGFLIQTGGDDLLTNTKVTVSRDDESARVEVRGQALSLLPGLRPAVAAVAAGPVERFVPATGAP